MDREAAEALVAGLDHDGKAEVLGAALRGVEAALEAAGGPGPCGPCGWLTR